MKELNAILTIAFRDVTKFLRDRPRIFASFAFPVFFIGIFGASLQANLNTDYNLLVFIFTGVLAQTLFQSTALGVISLIEDRENDFSQEIFVSPVSRYSIILGKISGETVVSLLQVFGIILFGFLIGIPLGPEKLVRLIPILAIPCFLGGAFGMLVLAQLTSQRAANQIFPFAIFPQLFLAGVFNPITHLPPFIFILSRLAPLTYAVDFIRGIYYRGTPGYHTLVLHSPLTNFIVITCLFFFFLFLGTFLFVRNERNK